VVVSGLQHENRGWLCERIQEAKGTTVLCVCGAITEKKGGTLGDDDRTQNIIVPMTTRRAPAPSDRTMI
jgi:hypothetical protein